MLFPPSRASSPSKYQICSIASGRERKTDQVSLLGNTESSFKGNSPCTHSGPELLFFVLEIIFTGYLVLKLNFLAFLPRLHFLVFFFSYVLPIFVSYRTVLVQLHLPVCGFCQPGEAIGNQKISSPNAKKKSFSLLIFVTYINFFRWGGSKKWSVYACQIRGILLPAT